MEAKHLQNFLNNPRISVRACNSVCGYGRGCSVFIFVANCDE